MDRGSVGPFVSSLWAVLCFATWTARRAVHPSTGDRLMIAACRPTAWQPLFLQLLPGIQRYARHTFRYLPREAREEAVQETIANSLVAFVRLWRQGRSHVAYPTVLARYGAAHARDGRSIAHRINSRDVLSLRAYRRHGIEVTHLFHKDKD